MIRNLKPGHYLLALYLDQNINIYIVFCILRMLKVRIVLQGIEAYVHIVYSYITISIIGSQQ